MGRIYTLTQAGAGVFARSTDDDPIVFTSVKLGDGTPHYDVLDADDLVNARLTLTVDTVTRGLLAWNEVDGANVTVGTVKPVTPSEGDYFLNLSASPVVFEQYTAGAWIAKSYDPSASTAGKYKYDSTAGKLYISTFDSTAISITASGSNAGVTSGFRVTEKGVYAKVQGDDSDVLFAYCAVESGKENYVSSAADGSETFKPTIILSVGDGDNILVIQSAEYASQTDFEALSADFMAHVNEFDGRITDDENAISDLTESLGDHIENDDNPHRVTADQIGAARENHTHDAANITSGTMPVERGGTGVGTLQALASGIEPYLGVGSMVVGSYVGDGRANRTITLGFYPRAVYVTPYFGFTTNQHGFGGLAVRGGICRNRIAAGTGTSDADWNTTDGKIKVTENGFVVNYNGVSDYQPKTNVSNFRYYYLAIK